MQPGIRAVIGLFLMGMIFQGCQGLQGVARYSGSWKGSADQPVAAPVAETPASPVTPPAPSPGRFKPEPAPAASDPLTDFVNAWKGVPYRYGGQDRAGTDCSGFTGVLFRDVYAINLPRTARDQFLQGNPVTAADLKAGDLVFFQLKKTRTISHVGVYLGNGQFAHASLSAGVTIDTLTDPYYADSYRGARRLR